MHDRLPFAAARAALVLAALLVAAGCPPKTPKYQGTRAGEDVYKKGGPKDKAPEPPQPEVRPEPYTAPADPERHRLDMRDFEREAYSILRSFSVSQKAFTRDINPLPVDLDGDGLGEYGFLWELTGLSWVRTPEGKGRAPMTNVKDWLWFRAKDESGKPLYWNAPKDKPDVYFETLDGYTFTVCKSNHGVVHHVNDRGIATRGGYHFVFYLPGKEKARNAGAEVPDGDPSLADAMERRFAGYAWPRAAGVTGRRVFFTCAFEAVWSSWNLKAGYSGLDRVPAAEAAFDRNGRAPANLDADPAIAVDETLEKTGLPSCDGEIWKLFGERKGVKRKFEWEWRKDEEIADFRNDGGTPQPWWEGEDRTPRKPQSPPGEEPGGGGG